MKLLTRLLIVTILASSSFMHSQDTIKIDEVVISKEIKIKKLLNKIKSNLIRSCDTTDYNFLLFQESFINNDTLIMIDEKIALTIKSFDNKFKKKYPSDLDSRLVEVNKRKFADYIEGSSPLNWISDYPIKKNLNVINLDFIKNYQHYHYRLEKINDEESIINFNSDSFYNGKIVFNPITNMPISIEYTNSIPYFFSHTSVKNLNSVSQFESGWNYLLENSLISFCCINCKLSIQNIEIKETIKDFEYKSYRKNGEIIYADKNNFQTSISLNRTE